jgi:NADH-quinone oxidoreductase subunit L
MTVIVALILLLPLVGAGLNGLVGLFWPDYRSREKLIGGLATALVAVPFGLAFYLFLGFGAGADPVVASFYTWMASGDLTVNVSYRVDELSLLMTLIVTGVGAVIHLYSIGYMHGDRGYWRYFAYLNLFIFMMLNLVLGNNLPLLFLGWEGVGLCSYLLIGFWYEDLTNSAAANKAFIVNRIGDFAVLIAMFLLFRELGTLEFEGIFAGISSMSPAITTWIVILLFIGATGKSAQIPLFTWLPDAMAGPTPVSALIHAATMVTSGLYLLARFSELVLAAFPAAMTTIAVVGAVTALMAATIAITQNDIKRVLAYSTVSQLGYMFLATGVGAFYVAIFHVFTHAFFKACLFLGSGSVIHAMEHVKHDLPEKEVPASFDPQDMRFMGGLKDYMPTTYRTYLISTLAIAGIPLFSGFFSKDEILFKAFEAGYQGIGLNTGYIVWIVGVVTAFLTAIYMMRSVMLTFHGSPRWPQAESVHPRESGPLMTIPLWILAVLSTVGGFVGLPAVIAHGELNWIHHWLVESGPVQSPEYVHHVPLAIEWMLIALSSVIAIGAVLFTWRRYAVYGLEYDTRLERRFGALYRFWAGKYYWDELYDFVIVRPVRRLADPILNWFDQKVIDGIVNGIAGAARGTGGGLRYLQTGSVQNYAMAVVFGAALLFFVVIFV